LTQAQLLDLFERTGIRAFAFFARGHADDPSRSHCVDSDDALDFFAQGLDMTVPHFMRKLEQWSCNVDEGMLRLLTVLPMADVFLLAFRHAYEERLDRGTQGRLVHDDRPPP
jgi:hypothetical protein